MKIKFTTSRACAEMLKGADSNCGSSLRSLANAGMASYASALAANRTNKVEDYMSGEIEVGPGGESEARQRGFGIEAMVILNHFHNCVVRQKTLAKWVKEIHAEVIA
jgi:hypothetical protein